MKKITKPKILHFISALDQFGGTERMLQRTIPKLGRYEHIFVSASGLGIFGKQLQDSYHVYSLGHRKITDALRTISRLKYIIHKEKPSLIVTYLIHADIIGRIAAKLESSKNKVACFNRGSLLQWQFLRYVDRLTKNMVDFYLTNSQTQKSKLSKELHISPQKITVITNGLDPKDVKPEVSSTKIREELGLSKKDVVLGYIGRLREKKGIEDLIRSMSMISNPNLKLVIVGDGSLKEKLVSMAIETDLERKIIFTGTKSNVFNYYQIFDVFVFPTHEEGMPNVLIEAMASGVPIVTSDIPECREVVGENAVLFKVGDSQDLAHKINRAVSDKKATRKQIENAKKRYSSKFTLSQTVEQLNRFYSKRAKP